MLQLFLNKNLVYINPPVKTQKEMLAFFAEKALAEGHLEDKEIFYEALLNRESKCSNIIEEFVAIPHARSSTVKRQFVGICIFTECFPYCGNRKNETVKIVFCVGSTKEEPSYLGLFADIYRLLNKDNFKKELLKAKIPPDVLLTISQHNIQEIASKTKQLDRHQIVLILNKKIESQVLSSILFESGIRCLTEIQSENYYSKSYKKIPFLWSASKAIVREQEVSKTIVGIADSENAVNTLFQLLKTEGIDMDEPGMGALYMSKIDTIFGGIDKSIDF
ncbi:MAG: PTS sugar transporter subunit IIA [Bacteriovoracaceae bacterium]|nr:PTS sugar transporter subunit IIA [Bacteriovoracaceae bacterium]